MLSYLAVTVPLGGLVETIELRNETNGTVRITPMEPDNPLKISIPISQPFIT